jgi:hypothetical protein
VWFHVDKLSSAHIYLRMNKGESWETIPQDLLDDCAQLTKANSIEGKIGMENYTRKRDAKHSQGTKRTILQSFTPHGQISKRTAAWQWAVRISLIVSLPMAIFSCRFFLSHTLQNPMSYLGYIMKSKTDAVIFRGFFQRPQKGVPVCHATVETYAKRRV